MKLNELARTDLIMRPASKIRNAPDGAHNGRIASAEFIERDSKFSPDGKRVALNLKIEVEIPNGEIVDLYLSSNYSWSNKGSMVKLLEKLEVLPNPGESISLDKLVNIPVQVIVENVKKDGVTYSNIASIKRIHRQAQATPANRIRKPSQLQAEAAPRRKSIPEVSKEPTKEKYQDDFDDLEPEQVEAEDDFEADFEEDFESDFED